MDQMRNSRLFIHAFMAFCAILSVISAGCIIPGSLQGPSPVPTVTDSRQAAGTIITPDPPLTPLPGAGTLPATTTTTQVALPEKTAVTGPPPKDTLETGPVKDAYVYTIRTKDQKMYFTTYKGVADYLSSAYPARPSMYDDVKTQKDYYENFVTEPIQAAYLESFIDNIKYREQLPEERVRLAVSLIQHIPYAITDRNLYPYEVLYTHKGKCEDKSILLAFTIAQLGYGSALFTFVPERHMAVGIQCPKDYDYMDTGYCFIEATAPAIMTYSNGSYEGVGKLYSAPNVIPVSSGASFHQISEEYTDAQSYGRIMNSGYVSGNVHYLGAKDYDQLSYLTDKYGLRPISVLEIE